MKLFTLLPSCLLALGTLTLAQPSPDAAPAPVTDSAKIYIQPLSSAAAPTQLVEIRYNPSTLLDTELVNYQPPLAKNEKGAEEKFRIGLWDAKSGEWKSATALTSGANFERGYRPTIVLTLDARGEVLGVGCKGAKVQAGVTRDFGPRVVVRKGVEGVQPILNRYVVWVSFAFACWRRARKKYSLGRKRVLMCWTQASGTIAGREGRGSGTREDDVAEVLVGAVGGCDVIDDCGWRGVIELWMCMIGDCGRGVRDTLNYTFYHGRPRSFDGNFFGFLRTAATEVVSLFHETHHWESLFLCFPLSYAAPDI